MELNKESESIGILYKIGQQDGAGFSTNKAEKVIQNIHYNPDNRYFCSMGESNVDAYTKICLSCLNIVLYVDKMGRCPS